MQFALDTLPYYGRVPKEMKANLRFRRHVLQQCESKFNSDGWLEYRREQWEACKRDPLYYWNVFCSLHEPRNVGSRSPPPVVPFITYEYQDGVLIELLNAIGSHDIHIKKSRDMGATWMVLCALEWYWHFYPWNAFNVMSWKKDLVDARAYRRALLPKIDFLLMPECMPQWLAPHVGRRELCRRNEDNESVVDGEATTPDAGTASRAGTMFLDEFSKNPHAPSVWTATRDVTDCRIVVGTPKGISTVFYELEETGILQLRIHWSQHPEKSRGLYRVSDGQVEIIDPTPMRAERFIKLSDKQKLHRVVYKFPDDYPFVTEGTPLAARGFFKSGELRSPWYDAQCDRARTPKEIAQELDMDDIGSDDGYFDNELLKTCIARDTFPPVWVGDFVVNEDTELPLSPCELTRRPSRNRLYLWVPPGADGRFPRDRRYVLGVDVAGGSGASNSVITIGDTTTRELIGRFVSAEAGDGPDALAYYARAIAQMCAGEDRSYWPQLVAEDQGPGATFLKKAERVGFKGKIWAKKTAAGNETGSLGWHNTKFTCEELFGVYQTALREGTVKNRCEIALKECRAWVCDVGGGVINSRAVSLDDPSGARSNHSDRAVADGLTLMLMGDVRPAEKEELREDVVNCLAARMRDAEGEMEPAGNRAYLN